ncbi:signal peptidase I [Psychrobacillus glaciei]|uniref:Signal peptidase I n=1 Tax=Psychrobacillus glaciei TaxID=2283160 RepID=A0A5J6SMX2_9BACI|nr:signal peptidase I [Psychrobacillus glaciei]QFF99248.1 signal peptidase I [Psychrobacillus glaciei]
MKKRMIIFLSLLLVGCSPQMKTITDEATSTEIEKVTPEDHQLLVVWGSDAMDRGNYDYNSIAHSDLVVDSNYDPLKRGDVLYYKMLESETKKNPMIPEDYLGRVVGLPGETVMIRYGHVYINNKRLDTFYGEATMTGSTEEEYLRKADLSQVEDIGWVKSYFKTDLNPIKVDEGTVFVLVDQWWRGTDSKDFGLLAIERIEGKVLGYSKK